MSLLVRSNPRLPSGDTWDTSTYTPASLTGDVPKRFDVVGGAVVLQNGIKLSGDTGIEVPDLTINRVNPVFVAGDTQITYNPNQSRNTTAETINISSDIPFSLVPNTVRLSFQMRMYETRYELPVGAVAYVNNAQGVTVQTVSFSTVRSNSSFYTKTVDLQVKAGYTIILQGVRQYVPTGERDNGNYYYGFTTTDIRFVQVSTSGNAWQDNTPNGITRV